MYQEGSETVRSILNKAFFTRLYIDGRKVTNQELREPFNILHDAYIIYRRQQTDREGSGHQHDQRKTYLPDRRLCGRHERAGDHQETARGRHVAGRGTDSRQRRTLGGVRRCW
jgi:hypothetical protein